MAVTSQELRRSHSQRSTGQHRAVTGQHRAVTGQLRPVTGPLRHPAYVAPVAQPQQRASRTPYVVTALLALFALALMANSLATWGNTKLNDMRYGRPRTTSLNGFVGHNEAGGVPTQFVAMNLNRRVVVFEIPGGDPAQTRTLTGPYLFGANEDLTPVRLRLALINDDKESDLVVSVKNEEIIYINENGSFRLITPEERATQQQRAAEQANAQTQPASNQ
jgi:hypothetical protein